MRYIKIVLPVAVCGLLIAYGAWGLYTRWHATTGTYTPRVVAHETPTPSEKPVEPSYTVPPDKPKSIDLPTIQASGFIQQVDITKTNAVGSPDNVLMAGWFTRSVTPGDAGLSIIDGHVQGKYQPGVFKRLASLKADDTFTVTFGDNSVRKFKVVSVRNYAAQDAAKPLFAQAPDITQQLNLITCAGKFDSARNQYDDRTIVVAVRL